MAVIIEKRSVDRIPDNERITGFWPLFFLWSGFTIAVGRLWQGSVITGAGFYSAVIGYIIAQIFMVFIAIGAVIGASEGLPGTMIMRSAFGIRGRIIPSIPIIIATTGWFGLQLGMTASALDLFIRSFYSGWDVPMKVQYVFWAFLMGVLSIYGYRVVMWFQKFVSPLLILLIPWMIFKMFAQYDVLYELNRPRETTMTIFEAITLVTGGGLAMMIAAADSSRYAKSRATAFVGYMTANWSIGILVPIAGMMGAMLTNMWDPAKMVDKLGLGLLGVIIVVFSAWSTNCMNPYWGGIALSTLTTGKKRFPNGIPRTISTSLVVGLGALTSVLGIYSIGGLMAFVKVLASTLGPANGILIADYFFLRGRGTNKLDADELAKVNGIYWYKGGWNPVAVSVWIIGVAYSTLIKSVYVLIPPVSTMVISGIFYFVLMKTVGRHYLIKSLKKSEATPTFTRE
ncbi:purine-cytosine permease family protein [Candidatus Latescibacterota bacterium]